MALPGLSALAGSSSFFSSSCYRYLSALLGILIGSSSECAAFGEFYVCSVACGSLEGTSLELSSLNLDSFEGICFSMTDSFAAIYWERFSSRMLRLRGFIGSSSPSIKLLGDCSS